MHDAWFCLSDFPSSIGLPGSSIRNFGLFPVRTSGSDAIWSSGTRGGFGVLVLLFVELQDNELELSPHH